MNAENKKPALGGSLIDAAWRGEHSNEITAKFYSTAQKCTSGIESGNVIEIEQDWPSFVHDCAVMICRGALNGISFRVVEDAGELIIYAMGKTPSAFENIVMPIWRSVGDEGWLIAHQGPVQFAWDGTLEGGKIHTLPTLGAVLDLIYEHQLTQKTRTVQRSVVATRKTSHMIDAVQVIDHRAPFDVARQWLKHAWTNLNVDDEPYPTLWCIDGEFFRWTGMSYENVSDGDLRSQIYELLATSVRLNDGEPVRPDQALVNKVMDATRSAAYQDGDSNQDFWIDDSGTPNLIAVENGLLDPRTRVLHPHSPRYFNRCALPIWFEPSRDGKPREWLQFLQSVWEDDEESIQLLQQWFGYFVAGGTEHQKILLLVGPPRSGKGTISDVLTQLLGPTNVAGPSLGDFASSFGLSQLLGKRVAIVGDARFAGRPDQMAQVATRLLSISGGDTLSVDRKFLTPWTGKLPVRLAIATNEVPRLTDQSGALASRFSILRMKNSFYGCEDLGLADRLKKELPSILGWALDGLDDLRAAGRFIEPASSASTTEDLAELGSPVQSFANESCDFVVGAKTRRTDLYRAWQSWCESQGRQPGNMATFGRDLKSAFPLIEIEQLRSGMWRGDRCFTGIKLKEEREPSF